MNKGKTDFLSMLLATFKVEAEEHIHAMASGLMALEKETTAEKQRELIENIFREAHSLKGAARAVNVAEVERVCQEMENVFSALKRKEAALSSALFDALHAAVTFLGKSLVSAEEERSSVEQKARVREIVKNMEGASKGIPPLRRPDAMPQEDGETRMKREADTQAAESKKHARPTAVEVAREEKATPTDTVRIATSKLESLLLQSEELLLAKLTTSQRAGELREFSTSLAEWGKRWSKASSDALTQQRAYKDAGVNGQLLEFVEWSADYVKSLETRLAEITKSAERDGHQTAKVVSDFLEDIKKVLMCPFSTFLEVFPKLVRDLSRDSDKEAELLIRGGEIEIDRRILEEMKDPLMHIVRNCLDHGIEKPEERARNGKSLKGTIAINIAQKEGGKVEILITDDGDGINVEAARAAAHKMGVVSEDESRKMDQREALSLVFRSGFSTSPIITDLSGRGLGLAIVQEKVEKLGGAVSFESRRGAGATLRIVLPITLATFRGVLVRTNAHLFVLPTVNVERASRIRKDAIKTVENKEVIKIDGQTLSLARLTDVLELARKPAANGSSGNSSEDSLEYVVVLASGERRIAFIVDDILNEVEVLAKSLGKQLSRVRNISGAAVLGTGKVVPILNVPDLMKSATKMSSVSGRVVKMQEEEDRKGNLILVAEDSITARTLIKNILETAGYHVKTAVDGSDAWATLRTDEFDLVVSDVDMPRMKGFELTAKIRADQKLSDLPVVLVTALESREDRERGIDVGANAYIVKSTFEQSNLLEVIAKLI
ncbi:MAG: hybrid sensor histidine kinase/response regulator [Candidatus Lindowbacteria bacterium]|nr:hybrid sensor histidine kinase/response regulator [Candidatus Lindowbacteria bacterium]